MMTIILWILFLIHKVHCRIYPWNLILASRHTPAFICTTTANLTNLPHDPDAYSKTGSGLVKIATKTFPNIHSHSSRFEILISDQIYGEASGFIFITKKHPATAIFPFKFEYYWKGIATGKSKTFGSFGIAKYSEFSAHDSNITISEVSTLKLHKYSTLHYHESNCVLIDESYITLYDHSEAKIGGVNLILNQSIIDVWHHSKLSMFSEISMFNLYGENAQILIKNQSVLTAKDSSLALLNGAKIELNHGELGMHSDNRTRNVSLFLAPGSSLVISEQSSLQIGDTAFGLMRNVKLGIREGSHVVSKSIMSSTERDLICIATRSYMVRGGAAIDVWQIPGLYCVDLASDALSQKEHITDFLKQYKEFDIPPVSDDHWEGDFVECPSVQNGSCLLRSCVVLTAVLILCLLF